MIPKIIHQIWLGPRPLPDEDAVYVETWKRLHPSWEHRLWTEDNLPDDVRPEVRERLRVPAERSDLLRLELVVRFGGVYVDTDFEALQPLDDLLEGVEIFAAYLRDGSEDLRINNAIFGATAQHPLLVKALAEARPRTVYGYDKAAVGPLFLDRMLQGAEATFFERRLFYPWPNERDGAVAYHHQARTWKDAAGLRRSLAIALRRRDAARRNVRGLEARLRLAADPASLARRAEWKVFAAEQRAERVRRRLDKRAKRAREVGGRVARPHWERLRARSLGVAQGRAVATGVPRVLHHIWLGDLVLTEIDERRALWQLANPGWQIRIWTESDIPADARPEVRERLRAPAERADLLRLDILRREGGVVVDPDRRPRPLARLLPSARCFAAAGEHGEPATAVVGATPRHPAIDAALAEQRPREWSGHDDEATGSGALARARAAGAEIALVSGFEPVEGDTAAARAAVRERLLAVEAEVAGLDVRLAALRRELGPG